jgi:hypothetical protein
VRSSLPDSTYTGHVFVSSSIDGITVYKHLAATQLGRLRYVAVDVADIHVMSVLACTLYYLLVRLALCMTVDDLDVEGMMRVTALILHYHIVNGSK